MKTGKHSLLNLIGGYVRAMMEQGSNEFINFDSLKNYFKVLATENGYPAITVPPPIPGKYKKPTIVPKSLGDATEAEKLIVANTIQEIADYYEKYLYYYTFEEKVYKSIGGRSLEEMIRDFPDMNKGFQE
jgi:hypothetical protein